MTKKPGQPVGGETTAPALDRKALVSCPLSHPQHSHSPSSQKSTEAPPIGSNPPKFKDDRMSAGAWAPAAVPSWQLAEGPPDPLSLDPVFSHLHEAQLPCVCQRWGLGSEGGQGTRDPLSLEAQVGLSRPRRPQWT